MKGIMHSDQVGWSRECKGGSVFEYKECNPPLKHAKQEKPYLNWHSASIQGEVQHLFRRKPLSKQGIEKFLNLTKNIYKKKSIAETILSSERMNVFILKRGKWQGCTLLLTPLFITVLEA